MNIVFELALPCGVRLQVVGPLPRSSSPGEIPNPNAKPHEGEYLWTVEGSMVMGRGYHADGEMAKHLGVEALHGVLLRSMIQVLQHRRVAT